MIGLLKDLLDHQAWADAVFFHAWGKSQVREDADLRGRVDHQVTVQEAFLKVLKGETSQLEPQVDPDFEALGARCRAAHGALRGLVQDLDPAGLERIVRVPWFPDPPCLIPVSDALVQVCLHSQHHRGQCMSRLKALGATPRNVDYIIWLWKQRPEARWDA
jgi:uncharacterized damage-inducible protein DinB